MMLLEQYTSNPEANKNTEPHCAIICEEVDNAQVNHELVIRAFYRHFVALPNADPSTGSEISVNWKNVSSTTNYLGGCRTTGLKPLAPPKGKINLMNFVYHKVVFPAYRNIYNLNLSRWMAARENDIENHLAYGCEELKKPAEITSIIMEAIYYAPDAHESIYKDFNRREGYESFRKTLKLLRGAQSLNSDEEAIFDSLNAHFTHDLTFSLNFLNANKNLFTSRRYLAIMSGVNRSEEELHDKLEDILHAFGK